MKMFNLNSNMRANVLIQKYNILIHKTKEDQERQNNKPNTFRIHPTHFSKTIPTLKISRQQDQPHQMLSLVDICLQHLWSCHPTPKEETSHPNTCNPVLPSQESTASLINKDIKHSHSVIQKTPDYQDPIQEGLSITSNKQPISLTQQTSVLLAHHRTKGFLQS
jgi:hypothetical protein